MADSELKRLRIDPNLFNQAFGRDSLFCDDPPKEAFLDKQTGNVIWLCVDDKHAVLAFDDLEEYRAMRESITAEPGR